MQDNIKLRERLAEVSEQGSTAHFGSDVSMLRSELDNERKLKLANSAQQYERSCEYIGELRDRGDKIKLKNSEIMDVKRNIDDLRRSLKESAMVIKNQGD